MDDPSSRLEDALRIARSPLPAAVVTAWAGLGLAAAPFVARNRTRLRSGLRVGVSLVAVGGAVWLLNAGTTCPPSYYRYVDEVLAQPAQYRGRRLNVHGRVLEGSFEKAENTMKYRFKLVDSRDEGPRTDRYGSLPVSYEGLVPDTLAEGRTIVVHGSLGPNGFEASPDGIMVKCPSKY